MWHQCNLGDKSGLECACVNNVDFTVLVSSGDRCRWVVHCVVVALKMTQWVEQQIYIKFCGKLEHFSMETIKDESEGHSFGQLVIDIFIRATRRLMHHVLCRVVGKHQITQVTQPLYRLDLMPCDFWLFPKLKSPLKGKRFQTISEIQENTTGQLMVIGKIVWGLKVPTLKETEATLSYVQCFLYLVFSSINVSIFYITWLDTFWTDLICIKYKASKHKYSLT